MLLEIAHIKSIYAPKQGLHGLASEICMLCVAVIGEKGKIILYSTGEGNCPKEGKQKWQPPYLA